MSAEVAGIRHRGHHRDCRGGDRRIVGQQGQHGSGHSRDRDRAAGRAGASRSRHRRVPQPARNQNGDGHRRRGSALPVPAARPVLQLDLRRRPEPRRRSVLRQLRSRSRAADWTKPLLAVRIAALAAVDAPAASYLLHVGPAMDAGVTVEQVQNILVSPSRRLSARRVRRVPPSNRPRHWDRDRGGRGRARSGRAGAVMLRRLPFLVLLVVAAAALSACGGSSSSSSSSTPSTSSTSSTAASTTGGSGSGVAAAKQKCLDATKKIQDSAVHRGTGLQSDHHESVCPVHRLPRVSRHFVVSRATDDRAAVRA